MTDHTYTINSDHVAHEVVEGEAILINFTTGSYYSLDGAGGVVWECLAVGPASASMLVAALSSRYAIGDGLVLRDSLTPFLADLEREGLVKPTEQDAHTIVDPDSRLPAPPLVAGTDPFEPPVLRKYSDLEALLLLDPIHDVSATGWPNTGPDRS